MKSRYNVWLNNIGLAEIDPLIYVADISYRAVELTRATERRAGGHGSFADAGAIESQHVDIALQIEAYETEERQRIMQRVAAWALNGGWLMTSDRPEQMMRVVCDVFPSVTSAMRWLDTITITFSAYEYPFWVDKWPSEAAADAESGEDAEADLYCPGYMPAAMEALITPDDTLTELCVSAGDAYIQLEGLNSSDPVKISYTEDRHILSITQGNVSVLDKRTSDSADDLMLKPGAHNAVSAQGDAAISVVFSVRGVTL